MDANIITDHFKKLQLGIANRDPSEIMVNNIILGDLYNESRQYQKAIEHYEKSLGICTEIGSFPGMAIANMKLGNAYLNLKEYSKAIKFIKNSLEMFIHIGDRSRIAGANGYLGNAYRCSGEYNKAIDYCKKGIEISISIGDQSGIAIHNANLGNAYLSLGEYNKAIDYCKKSLEISSSIGDQSGMAANHNMLGNAYSRLGEHKKSVEYWKQGLEISTSIGNQSEIADYNGNLGNAYFSLGEYNKAIDYYKKVLEISASIGDQSRTASINGNLGNAYSCLGEYNKAIGYCKKCLEKSTSIGDKSVIANNNNHLGNAYLGLGEYNKAIDYYKRGLKISISIGDQSAIAGNNNSLGTVYRCLGEYNNSIDYSKKGLEISTSIGDQSGIAISNGNLGSVYLSLGEYNKAIDYYKIGLEISTSIGNQSGVAANNSNLGVAYRNLGEYNKAIDYYKKGLEISTSIGDQSGIAGNNANLGIVYLSLGECNKAIEYIRKALEVSSSVGKQSGIAVNYANLGDAYYRLGDNTKASAYYKKSLEMSIAINDPTLIASAYRNLGNSHLSSGKYEDAVIYLRKSIISFDTLFLNSVPDENKLSYTIQYFYPYEDLMSCFISLEHVESGLLVIDLGRAKELHCSIERKQNSLNGEMFGYATATWKRIKDAEEKLEIKEIHNILQVGTNGTTILVFAFDLDNSLIFWILNDEVIFRKSDARLETLVQLINKLFSRVNVNMNRDSSFFKLNSFANMCTQYSFKKPSIKVDSGCQVAKTSGNVTFSNETILKELFQHLIKPVSDVVEGSKLIVVPDKLLFFVPFSSLIDENGCHLSHSYNIQITPSLHTLKFRMERPHDSDFGFALFVGNPTVGKVSLKGEEFAPAALPSATEEVNCLSKLFDARPLVEGEARKQVVLGLVSRASIIHIAAHGEPTRGEIMLAPEPSSSLPIPDDYLLTQQDITNISIHAHLVVLCCCHTGQGEISSEGVIGIARAFLVAGARTVLATLWPINDAATKEFMEVFYGELCQEISACEALRRAMNLFQKHEKETYRSIEIWAPFTIYGEDVMFQKHEIEKIREKSREMFSDFVVSPKSC